MPRDTCAEDLHPNRWIGWLRGDYIMAALISSDINLLIGFILWSHYCEVVAIGIRNTAWGVSVGCVPGVSYLYLSLWLLFSELNRFLHKSSASPQTLCNDKTINQKYISSILSSCCTAILSQNSKIWLPQCRIDQASVRFGDFIIKLEDSLLYLQLSL